MTGRILSLAAFIGGLLLAGVWFLKDRLSGEQARYEALQSAGFAQGSDAALLPGHLLQKWSALPGASGRQLKLGWFPAPRRLRYAVKGVSSSKPVQVFAVLRLAAFSFALPSRLAGKDWTVIEADLPAGFEGRSMALQVEGAPPGFEITQPFGAGTGGILQ